MEIIKYNANKGEAAAKVVGSTKVTAGADYSSAINDLNDAVAKNASDIANINKTISGLNSRFLRHGGDVDSGLYEFGRVASNDFFSPNYFTEAAGFRAVFGEHGYEINVRDIGDTTLPFNALSGTPTELPRNTFVTLTLRYNSAFQMANTQPGARVLVNAGIANNPANVKVFGEQMYMRRVGLLGAAPGMDWNPIEKEAGSWIVPLATNGRTWDYSLYYEVTVKYTGTTTLYAMPIIQGTINDTTTKLFGGGYSLATMKADSIVVEDGTNGIKVTATGIFKTTDGGTTWVPY